MTRMLRTVAFLLLALAALSAAASIQLDIPTRKQWNNRNGYCGECCVQQAALYFGTYVSQYRVRQIIDPTQKQDVWIPEHAKPVFAALRLTYVRWKSSQPVPQYQPYLVWIKGHLQQGHPVIFDVFVQGMDDPAYDHIMLATGFTSADTTAYHASDRLVFHDNYWDQRYSRLFGTLYDTRDMTGNGDVYEYCIPRDVDRGCAVTGIRDDSGKTKRVIVKVDRWSEPNVTKGIPPVTLNATLTMYGLTAGASYALLRYDDYTKVPTDNYLSSAYSKKTVFVAAGSEKTLSDQFLSDGLAIYRCVPN